MVGCGGKDGGGRRGNAPPQPGFEEFAYEDGPLPIGESQTITQPYIVALMIEAAEVKPGESVLEVGAGSGYAAAVMAQIADRVYAIERHPSLGKSARRRRAIADAQLDIVITKLLEARLLRRFWSRPAALKWH